MTSKDSDGGIDATDIESHDGPPNPIANAQAPADCFDCHRVNRVFHSGAAAASVETFEAWAFTCWTKAGATRLVGVTAFEGADAGPVPMALVAVTVNV